MGIMDVDADEDMQHGPSKKPRLDHEDEALNQAINVFVNEQANTEEQEAPQETDDVNMSEYVNDEEEEDSGDEKVDLDEDGLRPHSYAVDALMDEDEEDENIKTCMLCRLVSYFHRCREVRTDAFSRQRATVKGEDPPLPFVNASFEELLQHLTTVHSQAYNAVRQPPAS
jgi:hypothetical protein